MRQYPEDIRAPDGSLHVQKFQLKLAQAIKARVAVQGLRGKQRDAAVFEQWMGACTFEMLISGTDERGVGSSLFNSMTIVAIAYLNGGGAYNGLLSFMKKLEEEIG